MHFNIPTILCAIMAANLAFASPTPPTASSQVTPAAAPATSGWQQFDEAELMVLGKAGYESLSNMP